MRRPIRKKAARRPAHHEAIKHARRSLSAVERLLERRNDDAPLSRDEMAFLVRELRSNLAAQRLAMAHLDAMADKLTRMPKGLNERLDAMAARLDNHGGRIADCEDALP
jgi:hypothetical protein